MRVSFAPTCDQVCISPKSSECKLAVEGKIVFGGGRPLAFDTVEDKETPIVADFKGMPVAFTNDLKHGKLFKSLDQSFNPIYVRDEKTKRSSISFRLPKSSKTKIAVNIPVFIKSISPIHIDEETSILDLIHSPVSSPTRSALKKKNSNADRHINNTKILALISSIDPLPMSKGGDEQARSTVDKALTNNPILSNFQQSFENYETLIIDPVTRYLDGLSSLDEIDMNEQLVFDEQIEKKLPPPKKSCAIYDYENKTQPSSAQDSSKAPT